MKDKYSNIVTAINKITSSEYAELRKNPVVTR